MRHPCVECAADAGRNWGAKAAYFWLGGNLGVTIWAFFRLPETRGLSYAEMEILFANRISARKFGHVKVHGECLGIVAQRVPLSGCVFGYSLTSV
jgi:hypothetical protein